MTGTEMALLAMLGVALATLVSSVLHRVSGLRGSILDVRGDLRDMRGDMRDLRGDLRDYIDARVEATEGRIMARIDGLERDMQGPGQRF